MPTVVELDVDCSLIPLYLPRTVCAEVLGNLRYFIFSIAPNLDLAPFFSCSITQSQSLSRHWLLNSLSYQLYFTLESTEGMLSCKSMLDHGPPTPLYFSRAPFSILFLLRNHEKCSFWKSPSPRNIKNNGHSIKYKEQRACEESKGDQ